MTTYIKWSCLPRLSVCSERRVDACCVRADTGVVDTSTFPVPSFPVPCFPFPVTSSSSFSFPFPVTSSSFSSPFPVPRFQFPLVSRSPLLLLLLFLSRSPFLVSRSPLLLFLSRSPFLASRSPFIRTPCIHMYSSVLLLKSERLRAARHIERGIGTTY